LRGIEGFSSVFWLLIGLRIEWERCWLSIEGGEGKGRRRRVENIAGDSRKLENERLEN
jgi:hypothetical protein